MLTINQKPAYLLRERSGISAVVAFGDVHRHGSDFRVEALQLRQLDQQPSCEAPGW